MNTDYLLGVMSSVLGTGDVKVNGIDKFPYTLKRGHTLEEDLDERGMIGKHRILREFSLEKRFRFVFNTSPEFSDWHVNHGVS